MEGQCEDVGRRMLSVEPQIEEVEENKTKGEADSVNLDNYMNM